MTRHFQPSFPRKQQSGVFRLPHQEQQRRIPGLAGMAGEYFA